jgi:hypothetical protein
MTQGFSIDPVGDVPMTKELRDQIMEFVARHHRSMKDEKFPDDVITDDEKLAYLVKKMNDDAEANNLPFRATVRDAEDDPVAMLVQALAGTMDDPKVAGPASILEGVKGFVKAYDGVDISMAQIGHQLALCQFHTLANFLMSGGNDALNHTEELRRLVLRSSMLVMMDHYVNHVSTCATIREFKIDKEDLLADLNAIGMNRMRPRFDKMMERYSELVDLINVPTNAEGVTLQ